VADIKDIEALTEGRSEVPSNDRPDSEYDDPKRQWEILNPETLRYPLLVGGVERTIEVKTEFSINDLFRRRVMDDLGAFSKLVFAELAQLNPGHGSFEWVSRDLQYIDIALTGGVVSDRARRILVQMARYVDPFVVGQTLHERPSIEDVALGMAEADLVSFGLYLLNRLKRARDEAEAGGKASAAASHSGSPPSSASSATRASRKKKSTKP
jgi:hypothetical protein